MRPDELDAWVRLLSISLWLSCQKRMPTANTVQRLARSDRHRCNSTGDARRRTGGGDLPCNRRWVGRHDRLWALRRDRSLKLRVG